MLNLIDAYQNYLVKVKQASANTVASYMRDIRQFSQWLSRTEQLELAEAKQVNIACYMDHLQSEGRSGATLSRTLASLKNFYSYLISFGFMEETPVVDIQLERPEKKVPQILTSQEIERLLAQPVLSDLKGIRDKAMLEVMYATGVRVSEMLDLNLGDVNMDLSLIRCSSARKSRSIPLYPAALKALRTYIQDVRPLLVSDRSEQALFVNVAGSRMSRQGFWKIIKQYQEAARINKEITPHTLRHSFAVHLLENGADLDSLRELMGHCDIASTQKYTQMVNGKLKSVYQKCHPKA